MDSFLFIFTGIMCLYVSIKTISSPEPNKVFNKWPMEVTDVKKYNQFCGGLILGFGIVAEITIAIMMFSTGIVSVLCTVGIILEALLVVYIYRKMEKKFLKKR